MRAHENELHIVTRSNHMFHTTHDTFSNCNANFSMQQFYKIAFYTMELLLRLIAKTIIQKHKNIILSNLEGHTFDI